MTPLVPPSLLPPNRAALDRDDGKRIVFDCRFDLSNPDAGLASYLRGHVPGARFADVERALSGPVVRGKTGRHPLPAVDEFVERLRGFGVNNDSHVIAYDDRNGAFAARFWWLLRWLGHDQVSVCDGGYQAWLAQGGEPTTAVPSPSRGSFSPNVRAELVWSTEEVAKRGPDLVLLDARNPERFRGDVEPIDPVAGHIPGALSCPFVDNVDASGRFRGKDELRARFAQLLGDTPPEQVGVYCGSGVTACHDILAAAHAGLGDFRLYAGSWSEWITDPTRPVATGPR